MAPEAKSKRKDGDKKASRSKSSDIATKAWGDVDALLAGIKESAPPPVQAQPPVPVSAPVVPVSVVHSSLHDVHQGMMYRRRPRYDYYEDYDYYDEYDDEEYM